MNKNNVIAGALLLVGFIGLTAFGGKTREQQEAEIATAVTAKLDEMRAQLDQQCSDRVMAEAQTRYDAYLLEMAGKPSKPGASKPSTKPKTGGTAKPLPEPQKPAQPTDPKKDKMNQSQNDPTNTGGKKDKMEQQPNDPTNTSGKKNKMKSNEGGN